MSDSSRTLVQETKKLKYYVTGMRVWYFLCPFIALLLKELQLVSALLVYEAILIIATTICLLSQFGSGFTRYGIDYVQVGYQEEARKLAKETWGALRVSPLFISLPCIITVALLIISRILK